MSNTDAMRRSARDGDKHMRTYLFDAADRIDELELELEKDRKRPPRLSLEEHNNRVLQEQRWFDQEASE